MSREICEQKEFRIHQHRQSRILLWRDFVSGALNFGERRETAKNFPRESREAKFLRLSASLERSFLHERRFLFLLLLPRSALCFFIILCVFLRGEGEEQGFRLLLVSFYDSALPCLASLSPGSKKKLLETT